jgi:hypothetical protein
MIIAEFPEQNIEFHKPPDMSHSECAPLPAFQTADKNQIISCWKFTDDELLLVLMERKMWLRVWLPFQPPVHLSPEFPFLDENDNHDEIETVVEKLLDRKTTQFISKRWYERDIDSGIHISDSEEMKELLTEFARFLVATKEIQ